MSASRLLILGVLRRRPMHGYEVRRELETWGAAEWANVAYGSIYHGLSKMADEGLVEVIEVEQRADRRPARTVYRITEGGHAEFNRLLREYWWEPKPTVDPFQVALTFMDQLPTEELLGALQHRAARLRAALEAWPFLTSAKVGSPNAPRHIAASLKLAAAQAEAALRWMDGAIEQVEKGELP